MSAKHGDKGMPGSVPNVKRAAEVRATKQAKLTSTVNQLKRGSVGTALGTMVRKSIK